MTSATPISRWNRSVSSCAVAAGVTSMATTRMIPTVWRLMTMVSAMIARKA